MSTTLTQAEYDISRDSEIKDQSQNVAVVGRTGKNAYSATSPHTIMQIKSCVEYWNPYFTDWTNMMLA